MRIFLPLPTCAALLFAWTVSQVELLCYAAEPQPTNALSLSTSFPPEKLASILAARDAWQPFPTLTNRQAWLALPPAVLAHLVKLGEDALAKPLPPLPATLYLEYARHGNRSRFESVYFQRRTQLQNLVLAECAEAKGRFLDPAADALWALCEESTWCLPAHVGVQKAKVGLPDISEPTVDLFAGETAVTVSWTLFLLGPELDRVSPQIRRRAELELRQRILSPVVERNDFGWMALNVTRLEQRPNNWTPWICASVLTTALLQEADGARRVQIVHKMLRSLDGFLRFHPTDGSCDEGPSYWGRAGGSLLDGLDVLYRATAGQFDVFSDPLVQEVGRFIYRVYIAGDYFVPIGDCAARFDPERGLVFRYGERIGDSNMKALAAHGASLPAILGERFMGRQLPAIFAAADILAYKAPAPPLVPDVWLGSEELQLMTARSSADSSKGLYLAAWGAHNAQSHNHNDVGNILVFLDGQPVFVDAGAPTYTAQTFSSKRYEIWAFQSGFHNTPTINGVMQQAGRQFRAREVQYEVDDAVAQLQMDIAPAYPPSAQVKSWVRTARLNRGRSVELIDSFELNQILGETALNFLTPLEPNLNSPGSILLQWPQKQGMAGIRVEYDRGKLRAQSERIPLTDIRLAKSWGEQLYRLTLKAATPGIQDRWVLRIVPE